MCTAEDKTCLLQVWLAGLNLVRWITIQKKLCMNVISMCIADLEAEIYSKDRQYILMTSTSLFDSTELNMDVLFLQGQRMTREPIIILHDHLFFSFFF